MAQPQTLNGRKTVDVLNNYDGFVEKFKPKKTTDDCYTPEYIYEVIADYVENTYKLDRGKFVRPFYPGGDYENFDYSDSVVVDNPPFSILAKILKFYQEREIPFFLFAPALTLMSSSSSSSSCCLCTGFTVEYENGAKVNTSFITNLEDYRCRTAPELYKALDEATQKHKDETVKALPKYKYPDYVVYSPMLNLYSGYGVDLRIARQDSFRISRLDAQKQHKKGIFGNGYLLSERAKIEAERAKIEAERAKIEAERAKIEAERAKECIVWELSDREKEIIKGLGNEKDIYKPADAESNA